jgi:hypothetical protein
MKRIKNLADFDLSWAQPYKTFRRLFRRQNKLLKVLSDWALVKPFDIPTNKSRSFTFIQHFDWFPHISIFLAISKQCQTIETTERFTVLDQLNLVKFAYAGLVLGSNPFLICPAPSKTTLASKVVKMDSKIIIRNKLCMLKKENSTFKRVPITCALKLIFCATKIN